MTACAPWIVRRAEALLGAAAHPGRLPAHLRDELALLEGVARLSTERRLNVPARLERLARQLNLDLPEQSIRSDQRSPT